jgi:hypothetical protein
VKRAGINETLRSVGERSPVPGRSDQGCWRWFRARFRLDFVLPEQEFDLSIRRGRKFLDTQPRISLKGVKSGEILDLGDLRLKPESEAASDGMSADMGAASRTAVNFFVEGESAGS